MIGTTRSVRVFAWTKDVDMRKSYEGLHAIVRNDLGHDILRGDLFLFVNRRRNRAKVIFFDGTGLCIFMKRLERGRFAALWKRTGERTLGLSMGELQLFIEGCRIVEKIALSPPEIGGSILAISRD
jgi:transposase